MSASVSHAIAAVAAAASKAFGTSILQHVYMYTHVTIIQGHAASENLGSCVNQGGDDLEQSREGGGD